MKKKARCNNIIQVLENYAAYIYELINISSPKLPGKYFYNVVLSDDSYQPDDFEHGGSFKFKETIFKLLCAPLNDYQLKTKEEIDSFVSQRYFSFSKYLRLYAHHNRTITTYSKGFKTTVNKDSENEVYDSSKLNVLCQHTSLGAIINAVESLLLKKMAYEDLTVFEIQEHTSLKQLINIIIKENTNYSMEFSNIL